MSSLKFEIEAEAREDVGKGASRRLRHSNKVPAVIYGADLPPLSLTLCHDKISVSLEHEAFYSHILTLKMGKKNEKVILKSIQRHPSKARIQHIDFLRVKANQKLKMNVPIHFMGEDKAPGLKDGGIISHLMNDVEISCLPSNLPEYIAIDASNLGLNETLHLSDLTLPEGVELVALAQGMEDNNQPVVTITPPRQAEEETPVVALGEVPVVGQEAEAQGSEAAEDKKD